MEIFINETIIVNLMLIAKPLPKEAIDLLLEERVKHSKGFNTRDFRLPLDISCNEVWNIISVRNISPILEWFLAEKSYKQEETRNSSSDREKLESVLTGIVNNPEHTVIANGQRTQLTVDYLLDPENLVSNHSSVSIYQNIARKLGPDYSDINIVLSRKNPWIEPARFALEKSAKGGGNIQRIMKLFAGTREAYLELYTNTAYFNKTKLYNITSDIPLSHNTRRMSFIVDWVNEYEICPEIVGWNHALFTVLPQLFGSNKVLRRIPGFNLGQADVQFEFPDGDYSGRWVLTVDYNITPIDKYKTLLRPFKTSRERKEALSILGLENVTLRGQMFDYKEKAEELSHQLSRVLIKAAETQIGIEKELSQVKAEGERSIFYRIITHDIGNLLGPYQGLVSILQNSKPDVIPGVVFPLAKNSQVVLDRIKRDFQIQKRYDPRSVEKVTIEQSLDDVLFFLDKEFNERGKPIAVYTEISSVNTPTNYGRGTIIAYIHTLINAMEAVRERSESDPNAPRKILVKTREEDKKVIIDFYDSGVGFSPENLARYGKASFSTKANKGNQGTGGISIADIAKRYGCHFAVSKSDLPDYTTRVSFRIPLGENNA